MASATFSRCFSCTLLTIYALSLTIGIGLGMLIIDAAGDSSTAIGMLLVIWWALQSLFQCYNWLCKRVVWARGEVACAKVNRFRAMFTDPP